MPEFLGAAGTKLHYELRGQGPLLVCQPGGPAALASYLDDLGGVRRTLLLLDPRGVGPSAPAPSYAFADLADDLESLRLHLGLEKLDLLGQSAGAWPPMQYAARHPDRVAHLVLLTPSRIPIPLQPGELDRPALAEHYFAAEPWFPAAIAAFTEEDADPADAAPILYAADTPAVRAHSARPDNGPQNIEARNAFWSKDFDRAKLDQLTAPVTIIAGDLDIVTGPVAPEILASWFPKAKLTWLRGVGHLPWVVEPAATAEAIEAALNL
jgi:proline iminopeptidase